MNTILFNNVSSIKIGDKDAKLYLGTTLLSRFIPVRYISSTQTGGQYIDLGCKLMENTDDIEIDIKFIMKDDPKNGLVSSKGGNLATLLNSILEDNSSWPGFVLRRDSTTGEGFKSNLYLYAKWQFDDSSATSGKYYANNLGGGYTETTRTTNKVLYEKHFLLNNIPSSQCHNVTTTLFCTYIDYLNKYDRFTIADLYYLKLKKGGQVIRDLIPVFDQLTNEAGLYDKENDVFYKSLGEEPFAYSL